ncbi:MAG: hypothetical protein E7525_00880 [Ruminococcaceae bacterium]|nr:hypothetical protein [Oscillospiraceae bacterium]
MGLFGKKKLNDQDGHNNNLFTDDDDFYLMDDSPFKKNLRQKAGAPHAFTADEIAGSEQPEEIPMSSDRTPNSVYEQLKFKATVEEEETYVPSWATAKRSAAEVETKAETETVPAPKETAETKTPPLEDDDFLAKCKKAVDLATTGVHYDEKAFEAFTTEEYYKPLEAADAVSAVDVDDIIRRLKSEHNFPEVESNPEELVVTDEEVEPEVLQVPTEEILEPEAEVILNTFTAPAEVDTESVPVEEEAEAEEPEIPVEEIPMALEEAGIDAELFTEEEESVKIYAPEKDVVVEVDAAKVEETLDIETAEEILSEVHLDVEIIEPDSEPTIMQTDSAEENTEEDLGSTVVFGGTPEFDDLSAIISQKADSDFSAPVIFDEDDDETDDEEDGVEELPYYETEDKELKGLKDYKTLDDAASLRTKLMEECAVGSMFTALSFVATAFMALVSVLTNTLGTSAVGFINLLLLVAVICFNYRIFFDLKHFSDRKFGFDSCVSAAAIVTLIQNIVSCFVYDGAYSGITGAAAFLISANALFKLLRSRRTLKGLEIIANSEQKNAVVATEGTTSASISSGAVDGESITLVGRKAVNIKHYMRNCGYKSPFDLKARILLGAGLAVALLIGLVIGIVLGLGEGLTMGTLVLCACYPACAVMTAEMPMYLASKKANNYGAMLAGYRGAYKLNKANVIGVKTSDLFPEGTVTLYDMKPLSSNEVGHSIMNAAAVAIAANSPLAPIFKNIIKTSKDTTLPEVTGVQYENKMGITGWIGELTVLIGNRNLMQGHNVAVPPASVDQKILRNGYFPVYVACDGIPCLLFIVKYEADEKITRELRSVCDTGMTVVVYPEDANASDIMICDYFGLPNDAVKVMRHNGRLDYEKAIAETETVSAPAGYGKNICGLFSAVASSINLKGAMSVLTVLYVIAAVLGVISILYLTAVNQTVLLTSLSSVIFQSVFMVIAAVLARMVNR